MLDDLSSIGRYLLCDYSARYPGHRFIVVRGRNRWDDRYLHR
jgi:hypothetical protein